MTTALKVAPEPLKPCKMQSASGVTYELMLVTPETAEGWLAKNVGNRRARKALINKYARDMSSNRWQENGSAIVRAKDGTLLDGQNRLIGCMQTGSPFWSLVVQNVELKVQPTIDDGAKRTMSDRLTFRGEPNSNATGAILRRIMLWEAGYTFNTGAYQPTSQEQLDFLDANDRVRSAVAAAVHYRSRKLLPASVIGLCWYVFSDLDADACVEFFDRLDDGSNLAFNNPIQVLRNKLIDLTREPGRVPEDLLLHYVVKTWNLKRANKTLQVLRIGAGEKFPVPR